MKRVLQVIYYDPVNYPPTLNTSRVLGERGVAVDCIGYHRGQGGDVALPPGVRYHYLNSAPGGWRRGLRGLVLEPLQFRRAVTRFVDRTAPDLVISYDQWGLWATLPVLRARRAPVVFHVHDSSEREKLKPWSRESLVLGAAERNLDRCERIVFPERARADLFARRWRTSTPVAVIANSAQRRRPVANTLLKDRIARDRGVRPERLAVVVGNIGLYAELIGALAAIDARWHLAIIGCGSPEAIALVRRVADARGIGGRLHVFPYTPYDTVREWLVGCDVGITLHPEGSDNVNWRLMGSGSVKTMEYMAAGIPSVVSPRSAFERLSERTGALAVVDHQTAEGIAAVLRELTPGGERWRRLADAAVAAHLSEYNYEAQLTPVLELLGLAPT